MDTREPWGKRREELEELCQKVEVTDGEKGGKTGILETKDKGERETNLGRSGLSEEAALKKNSIVLSDNRI